MTPLINFKNWSLDCYSKSIDDFIAFLRGDILRQVEECRKDENYKEYEEILEKIKSGAKKDDFIKEYFNENNNEKVLSFRKGIIDGFIKWDLLLGKFQKYISKKIFNEFYFNYNFITPNDFSSNKDSKIDRYLWIDEVLTEKIWDISLYLHYKVERKKTYIYFYLSEKGVDDQEKMIDEISAWLFEFVQGHHKRFHEDNNNFGIVDVKIDVEQNKKGYHRIIVDRGISGIRGSVTGSDMEAIISENMIHYLNNELTKRIIQNRWFFSFLNTFVLFTLMKRKLRHNELAS